MSPLSKCLCGELNEADCMCQFLYEDVPTPWDVDPDEIEWDQNDHEWGELEEDDDGTNKGESPLDLG